MNRIFFTLALVAPMMLLSIYSAEAGPDCEPGKQDSGVIQSAPAGVDVQVIAQDMDDDAVAGDDAAHGAVPGADAAHDAMKAGKDAAHDAVVGQDAAHDADNTDRNERDRDGDTLTPLDQGKSEADRTITQQIRKAVVDNDSLSTNAHNVKIITVDGTVTLRGPVKSAEEKATVEALAEKTSGVKTVDNQLEVERDL